MHNNAVQERLCTEPKDSPDEALQFAFAFEKGIKRQAHYGKCKFEMKSKLIFVSAISNPENVCFRCGAHNFKPQDIPQCKAVKPNCGKCGIMGHFARCCGKIKKRMSNPSRRNSSAVRRVNYPGGDSSEGGYDENTDKTVSTIVGNGETPFNMKGRVNNNKFSTKISSGSLVTIFTTKEMKDILRSGVLFERPLSQSEKYVNFNRQSWKSPNLSMCN